MFRKFAAAFLSLMVFTAASAFPVSAQSDLAKREKRAAEIKTKIGKIGTGEKARVNVKLYGNTRYEGHLREVNDTDFVVVTKDGASHNVNYSDVRSLGGQNLSTGAKIAIGAGIGLAILIIVVVHQVRNFDF